jgi:hypothetical protein
LQSTLVRQFDPALPSVHTFPLPELPAQNALSQSLALAHGWPSFPSVQNEPKPCMPAAQCLLWQSAAFRQESPTLPPLHTPTSPEEVETQRREAAQLAAMQGSPLLPVEQVPDELLPVDTQ